MKDTSSRAQWYCSLTMETRVVPGEARNVFLIDNHDRGIAEDRGGVGGVGATRGSGCSGMRPATSSSWSVDHCGTSCHPCCLSGAPSGVPGGLSGVSGGLGGPPGSRLLLLGLVLYDARPHHDDNGVADSGSDGGPSE